MGPATRSQAIHEAVAASIRHNSDVIDQSAIDDDLEEEEDSFDEACAEDHISALQDPHHDPEANDEEGVDSEAPQKQVMTKVLKTAAAEIIVDKTRKDYERSFENFMLFLKTHDFISPTATAQDLVQSMPCELPEWIALWIMSRADTIDIYTGAELHPGISRLSYGGAQKLRAAVTHKFGRDLGLGFVDWTESPVTPGKYIGNPSTAIIVTQYMISLRRRKARRGTVVTSARAMDEPTMRRLFEYNTGIPTATNKATKVDKDGNLSWAGPRVRMMLHCLYVISMLCLLRYDEALNIQWQDIRMETGEDGLPYVIITLLVRKTHQNGDPIPFILYLNREQPHMCAVTAIAAWWKMSEQMGLEPYGYVFRRRHGYDRVAHCATDGMSSESFLVCFRSNLCDIGINPRMYGTHSFRRGGCQYLHLVLRVPIREICAWGGWAEKFDNPGTIFKYLLSWTDAPHDRGDFFNPKRKGTDRCGACGRTCHCA